MLRQHTDLFTRLTIQKDKEVRLNSEEVSTQLAEGKMSYEAMDDLLRETNDAQFGIVSTLIKKQGEPPTWLRDATNAISLEDRIPRDAPVIEANNALLRCLSRLRPIDYAINKKIGEQENKICTELRNEFSKLTKELLEIAQESGSTESIEKEKQKRINDLERKFNTLLVEKLHEANLTKGCESEKEAEKLLFYYRNLSSVLSPARTMVTLTYDKTAKILQRETQYPVTEKTKKQKDELKKLEGITPYPEKDKKNSHNAQRLAMQEADSLFAKLIDSDDTALGAQARKTHLVGAKNAFIVKNELIQLKDELPSPEDVDNLGAKPKDTLWLARMGSPAFMGKGEKDETVQVHTQANLEQVHQAAAKKMGKDADEMHIHVTILNTNSLHQKQSIIVNNVNKATNQLGGKVSYVPSNVHGTFHKVDIAEGLNFGEKEPPRGRDPTNKADRLESVSKVVLAASNTPNTLSIVHCASGQDRTGTAVEKATQEWMKERYAEKELDTKNIEKMRAEGGNAAEITTHHIHGSPGMKTDSLANNYFGQKSTFGERATQEMYLASADTNKENEVNDVAFLADPNEIARKEYDTALAAFEESLRKLKGKVKGKELSEKEEKLYQKGNALLQQIKDIADAKPGKVNSKKLNELTQVLKSANKGLKEVDDVEKTRNNVANLACIAKKVSAKAPSAWKKLGLGLLGFACAALVVVGVLAVIPSGGTSLLIAATGAAGLDAIGGFAALHQDSKKSLVHSVNDLKSALKVMKESEPKVKEDDEDLPGENFNF